jgi:hypothetical protein
MRDGKANGYLTIVLLAKDSAVLSDDADRVPTFFRDSRVIDDPGGRSAMSLHCVQYTGPRNSEYRRIHPLSVGNKMMRRLMPRSNATRIYQGCHRFNTLPLARQQQSGKIGLKRFTSVSMVNRSCNLFDITLKSEFNGIRGRGHAPMISQSVGKAHLFMTQ